MGRQHGNVDYSFKESSNKVEALGQNLQGNTELKILPFKTRELAS